MGGGGGSPFFPDLKQWRGRFFLTWVLLPALAVDWAAVEAALPGQLLTQAKGQQWKRYLPALVAVLPPQVAQHAGAGHQRPSQLQIEDFLT